MGKRGEGYGSEDHFLRYRSERAGTTNARSMPGRPLQFLLFARTGRQDRFDELFGHV
jgi:hypothetical protein